MSGESAKMRTAFNISLLKPYTFNGYKLTSQDDYMCYMVAVNQCFNISFYGKI